MRNILGCDPGLSGALAILDPNKGQIRALLDMPKLKRGDRSDLDLVALAAFIGNNYQSIQYAVVEDVAAAPKQGVTSMFTFGKVTGIVVGMIAAHYIPIFYVKPSVWKFQLGLSKDKKRSIVMARKLWPDTTFRNDGQAEAALLAHFGKCFNV